MAQITKTVREALADNERRVLASELSACVRALDHADRRQAADKDVAPYLSVAILQLDAVAKDIAAWRPKHAEPVDPFLVQEHATLKRDVDEKVRWYLTHFGDVDFVRLGAVAWARKVVRRVATEKAQVEQRRVARATGRPAPKPVKSAPVIKRSAPDGTAVAFVLRKMSGGRPGYCDTCGKARERTTLQGLCPECIDKHFPTLRR